MSIRDGVNQSVKPDPSKNLVFVGEEAYKIPASVIVWFDPRAKWGKKSFFRLLYAISADFTP